eukprot:CAMPEP_0116828742 /NCGR_PEP_ID=MMETSP0418-20121206/3816_1 /TAXON_ID=1158023 /ORGANISM="Astrosyne radiata, Strain 13vi08-1A" /LENGTH=523 /DNA_ID=CAMNT_0004457647 /DNA_START=267 /DNA_END=1838 /DNA_ORIENTATION=-
MGDHRHHDARSEASSSTTSSEAILLSRATSTATLAARSILESGGTEQTALRTAKAAAQSTLLVGDTTKSTKMARMMRKRRAKRQAEVVASMALVSASQQVMDNKNMRAKHETNHVRFVEVTGGSRGSSSGQSMSTSSSAITPRYDHGRMTSPSSMRPSPKYQDQMSPVAAMAASTAATAAAAVAAVTAGLTSSYEEFSNTPNAEEEKVRPVAISVESKTHGSSTSSSDEDDGGDFDEDDGVVLSSPQKGKGNLARDVLHEDPIYDNLTHQLSNTIYDDDSGVHTNGSISTLETSRSDQSFIEKHIDPMIGWMKAATACGGREDMLSDDEHERDVPSSTRLSAIPMTRGTARNQPYSTEFNRSASGSTVSSVDSGELVRGMKTSNEYVEDTGVVVTQSRVVRQPGKKISFRENVVTAVVPPDDGTPSDHRSEEEQDEDFQHPEYRDDYAYENIEHSDEDEEVDVEEETSEEAFEMTPVQTSKLALYGSEASPTASMTSASKSPRNGRLSPWARLRNRRRSTPYE